jgi:hypothetical protein
MGGENMIQKIFGFSLLCGLILAPAAFSAENVPGTTISDTEVGQVKFVNRRFEVSADDIIKNLKESPAFENVESSYWNSETRAPINSAETFLISYQALLNPGVGQTSTSKSYVDPDLRAEIYVSVLPSWYAYYFTVSCGTRKISKEAAARAIRKTLPTFPNDTWELKSLVVKRFE